MINGRDVSYTDYDRISDTLLYFDQNISLRFNVSLASKDRDSRRRFFHTESQYQSRYSNVGNVISIRRQMTFFFSIDDRQNFTNSIMIGVQDIYFLRMLMEKNILPWFIGKNIYSTNPDNGKIIITGKWRSQQFTLSDYKYLEFMPIVMEDENGKTNYGIRMVINNPNSFVDIDLNKFSAFYYIISNTDMYSVACSMVNYAKNAPYGINVFDMNSSATARDDYYRMSDSGEKSRNFFDKL